MRQSSCLAVGLLLKLPSNYGNGSIVEMFVGHQIESGETEIAVKSKKHAKLCLTCFEISNDLRYSLQCEIAEPALARLCGTEHD